LVSATKTGNGSQFVYKTNLTVQIRKSNLKENIMSFKSAVLTQINEMPARTANGMKSRATSASAVLDFFGKAGSSRGTALVKEFTAALVDNQDLAIRALLWSRDIRSGAGERKQFRDLLVALESANPALAGKLMHKIPLLGRWDDLFAYQDPINRRKALEMYADALRNGDGLAAKWAPREKSSKSAIAFELRKTLELTPREYRKLLSATTNVVESQMCAKTWNDINFSHVPSLASARYQKAFGRNAGEAYSAYLRELQKPESERNPKVKINASAVYPYDVVKSVIRGNAAIANEQWKALPNYVGSARIMPMVDVSGSMGSLHYSTGTVQPIDVSISLGLYLSEKNTSDFKDMFLTFSGKPKLEVLKGSLSQRVAQLETAGWEMNTDLHAAFEEILRVAVRGKVAQEDMPEILLILSDMQFDACTHHDDNAQQMIARKYAAAGYTVPRIVFWNLSSYGNGNTPVRFDDRGVCHVSGFSPAIMKSVLSVKELEDFTPFNVMVRTLMTERYDY
jgi:hypothetical protein